MNVDYAKFQKKSLIVELFQENYLKEIRFNAINEHFLLSTDFHRLLCHIRQVHVFTKEQSG